MAQRTRSEGRRRPGRTLKALTPAPTPPAPPVTLVGGLVVFSLAVCSPANGGGAAAEQQGGDNDEDDDN